MAMKSTSIEKREIPEGKSVEGFLVKRDTVKLVYQTNTVPNDVPQVLFQDKEGKKFSVLLGMTAVQDLAEQTMNAWTRITRGKKIVPTEKGKNSYYPYTFEQDTDLMLK